MAGFRGEVVYSVGGGLTADAAKYMARKNNLPMVRVPTALSVDAFITDASGIRRDGCVYYIETKPPENLVLDCAETAGYGDRDGLKILYDCLAMEVQLCNQVGYARPEERTEHYFAYCVENVIGYGLPHGNLVGPGIVPAARGQGQDTSRLESALKDCHIPLDRISPKQWSKPGKNCRPTAANMDCLMRYTMN